MEFTLELQAARLRLVNSRPYLARAAWALTPVSSPGLGGVGVDRFWRLYFDPAIIADWSVDGLASVLYHEICHLLRDHPSRMKDCDTVVANLATDFEINDDLIKEGGVRFPHEVVLPGQWGLPEGLLAEEYYDALMQESARNRHAPDAAGTNPKTKGSSTSAFPGAESNRSNEVGGPGHRTENGDAQDFKFGASDSGQTERDDSDCQSGSSSGSLSDTSMEPRASFVPASHTGEQGVGYAQIPVPGRGVSGSCATGQLAPWEDPDPPADSIVSPTEAELIRHAVADAIQEHVRARGYAPGHWERWVREQLAAKVNWRKELASILRQTIANISGMTDFSYRRPARRQGQVDDRGVILPSLRSPLLNLAVIVDTSGSIDDHMLAQASAEVSKILKAFQNQIVVLTCDYKVQDIRTVRRIDQIQFMGGGGTDMGNGLAMAAKLVPRPHVVIVMTDGLTPWPDRAPRGMKVIILLLRSDVSHPSWARAIRIGD